MGLDSVEFLMEVERRFGLEIPDAAAAQIETLAELHAYVTARLAALGRPTPARAVAEGVREILVERFAVPPGRVTPGARIARDLGLE